MQLTDDQIKHMADRFLAWPLPADFKPDNGINFEPLGSAGTAHEYKRLPSGTNLWGPIEAEAMVRHMVAGLPNTWWLIEAPGQNYLTSSDIGCPAFRWTKNHDQAIKFCSKQQAMNTMLAIRDLAPHLWAFAAILGDAWPVEHGWL